MLCDPSRERSSEPFPVPFSPLPDKSPRGAEVHTADAVTTLFAIAAILVLGTWNCLGIPIGN